MTETASKRILGDIKAQLVRAMHAKPNSRALPDLYQYFYELEPNLLYDSVLYNQNQTLSQYLDSKHDTLTTRPAENPMTFLKTGLKWKYKAENLAGKNATPVSKNQQSL